MPFKENIHEARLLTSIEGNFSSARSVKSILFHKLDSRSCVFSISHRKMVFFWLVILRFIFGCSLFFIKGEEKYLDCIQYFWKHMIFTEDKTRIKCKAFDRHYFVSLRTIFETKWRSKGQILIEGLLCARN